MPHLLLLLFVPSILHLRHGGLLLACLPSSLALSLPVADPVQAAAPLCPRAAACHVGTRAIPYNGARVTQGRMGTVRRILLSKFKQDLGPMVLAAEIFSLGWSADGMTSIRLC